MSYPARITPILVGLAVLLGGGPVHAKLVHGVQVNFITDTAGETRHGYAEYRFTARNVSEKPHTVRFEIGSPSYPSGGISLLRRDLVLEPGAAQVVSLMQPGRRMDLGSVSVTVDGREHANLQNIPQQHCRNRSGRGAVCPSVLVSRRLNRDELSSALDKSSFAVRSSGRGSVAYPILRAESEVTAWSTSWLGYTRFDAIMLHRDDLATMPAALMGALQKYVRCGGMLAVLGATEFPWATTHTTTDKSTGFQDARDGFGSLTLIPFESLGGIDDEIELQHLWTGWTASAKHWDSLPGVKAENSFMPVTDSLQVPVRGFVGVMALYALLVGPVAVIVLGRFNRRIWLLWIVPAAALAASAVIGLYALLSEGVTPSVASRSLTYLDQQHRQAITLAVVGYYCPIVPREHLAFRPDTEVTASLVDNYRSRRFRLIDWSNGQHWRDGWLQARVPAYFHLRQVEHSRLRLERTSNGDEPLTLVNGLGAPVRKLRLLDHDGKLYEAADVEFGAAFAPECTGSETVKRASQRASRLRDLYGSDWKSWSTGIPNEVENQLRPGWYVAELEGDPFADVPLKDRAKLEQSAWVIGRLENDTP